MLHARLPLETHAPQHVLELAEVQALVTTDDVQAALEGVQLLPVEGRGQVARCVQGRAVGLAEEARRAVLLVLVDAYDQRALGLLATYLVVAPP